MKKIRSGEEDKPGGSEFTLSYEIPSSTIMEGMFAGSFVKNLALAAKTFGVKTAARDLSVKILSDR